MLWFIVYGIFSWTFCPRGKGAMRLTAYVKHQPVRQGQSTKPGTTCSTLFDKCVGSSTSPFDYVILKMQEMGPTVYSLYPRRLERLLQVAFKIKKAAHSPQ